jgi:tRNA(Ile)-lysidine synthase
MARRSELRLLRPLLTVPKSRLLATLAAADIAFADDPSNRDPRFARPRLRELMPRLAAEGLTAQRLALLSWRIGRAEIALDDALNKALMRLVPGPWPEKGPVTVEVAAFADLAEEIALRLLGRLIEWAGNEGPVELGKLEALCASLESPVYDTLLGSGASGRFRRTLAGALITLSGGKLTVERAPSRRTGGRKGASGRGATFTKPR